MDTLYSLLDPLVLPLEWLLVTIHETLGVAWAWSIVVLTVIVRIAMLPLTIKQQQSFRAMQALQPEIKKLQQKHKGDRQRLNEEMAAFYKENKVNPYGSCLPLLVQLPIFFALYILLSRIGEEVLAGDDLSMFGGWIPSITMNLQDLAATTLWPLMAIYVLSQMGSTILMPTSMDPKQKYIFLFLPIVFAYFIVNPPFGAAVFPAGLLIYWITTNLWTCGQAAVIRVWFPPPLPPAAKQEMPKAKKKGGLLRRGGPATAMPKARKEQAAAEPSGAEELEAPAAGAGPAPAPRNKAQRRKRPAKPPKGGRKGGD
jgi:YidC/Oxa1 family membrane protein insertase